MIYYVSIAEEVLHQEKSSILHKLKELEEELQLTESHLLQSQERKIEVYI